MSYGIRWGTYSCATRFTGIWQIRKRNHYKSGAEISWNSRPIIASEHYFLSNTHNVMDWWYILLAEWRSDSVSALPCERPGFAYRTRLREIIPANNCAMQEQNNWGNWGSPGVMKLWVAWEVLRWLIKFRSPSGSMMIGSMPLLIMRSPPT